MNDTVVIGLGNPLLGDEGIGLRVLEALERRGIGGVDFADCGVSSLAALHAMAGRRKAVVVDCAFMGAPPGALRRFLPDAVRPRAAAPRATHTGDLFAVLHLSRRLGEAPDEVVIYGIQPARIAPGMDLSPALRERVEDYCRTIADELPQNPDA